MDTKRWLNLASLLTRPRPALGVTPAREIHRENKWRLLRYEPVGAAHAHPRTPVLLVPSLINRHYVLDLMPGKSFAEWLVAQGHDTYMLDWGTPEDEDRYLGFDDIVDGYLGRAIRRAAECAASARVHLLGYCLGGTLVAIHAAVRPERVASLTLVAAPIGFHDEGLLSRWTRTRSFDVDAVVAATGNVPWQLMQSAFHLLRPTMTLSKAVHLVDRAWDDEFLDGFLAIESWGNDNVSFPGACYRRYIQALYRDDGLLRGTLTLSGKPVRLAGIGCPVHAVTFEHDHIVPHRSASVVLEHVSSPDKVHLHLGGGHVGAVVSKKAATGLWPALSGFWLSRDGEPPARAAPKAARPKREAAPRVRAPAQRTRKTSSAPLPEEPKSAGRGSKRSG